MEYERNLKDYPVSISLEKTKIILEQMKKKVCKIKIGRNRGTGFFCKIPYQDNNNLLSVLITNNHVIDLEKNNDILIISINNEDKEIELENRITYTNKEYDITIIEIKNKDGIDNFLELDENINKNINKSYVGESIYILHYPREKINVSYGIIKDANRENKENEYDFNHLGSTEPGSSGGPILNIENNKVIGIHKGYKRVDENNIEYDTNIGLFIKYGINDFLNNIKNQKKIAKLDLSNKSIGDEKLKIELSKIKEINELKELDLNNNYISDIKVLEKVQLEKLNLGRNKISNINILDNVNFKELKELNLYSNNISDIKVFEKVKFQKLEILNLGENVLSNNINILENVEFKELKELNLSSNNIYDIKVLKNVKFKKLEKLNLGRNIISDINILENADFK